MYLFSTLRQSLIPQASHCEVEEGFEPLNLLPPFPKCWITGLSHHSEFMFKSDWVNKSNVFGFKNLLYHLKEFMFVAVRIVGKKPLREKKTRYLEVS